MNYALDSKILLLVALTFRYKIACQIILRDANIYIRPQIDSAPKQ